MMKKIIFLFMLCCAAHRMLPAHRMVVIGSGPAGLTAGLYGVRAKLDTTIIMGDNPGGQLTGSGEVENWPGSMRRHGADIIADITEQVVSLEAHVVHDAIVAVDFSTRPFQLFTQDHGVVEADTVIIATGSSPKKLGVSGEQKYWGMGVSSCAVCDCFLYDGLDVAIVGGGDSAVEEALHLVDYARKVTIFVRKPYMRAAARMQEKLQAYPGRIQVAFNKEVIEVLGDGHAVTGLHVRDTHTGLLDHVNIDGLFLAIGHTPNTIIFKDWLTLLPHGYIHLPTRSQMTEIPGIFVAGDVADDRFRQAVIAAGSGAQAALEAIDFLRYSQ